MRHILLFFTALLTFSCIAQNVTLYGVAPSYSQMGKISGKWSYNLNATSAVNMMSQTVENKHFPAGHTHFVLQAMSVYQLNKKWSLGGGYAFGRHNIFGLRENENRLIAQISYQHKLGNFIITHRGRYEWRQPINLQTHIRSQADIGRYQFWVTYPLYDASKTKKGFYLTASNEAFLYFKGATNGPVSSRNGSLLSENWMHLGGGYNAGKTRAELGYCFQALVRNKVQDYRLFNLLQINIYHTINWDDVQYWWYL
ncbi:DUF2490 domain-containing protein [Runella salmonicolor]|uniref:DUF2490 domain-containing protein n=1 Tax=Runella salmonicolor TaxID=2950278 RepID=A0ABT1FQ64_9BACT|nr:DUF2490 domain-containing protein [Runella salmonicolor]MCP1383864.1 DUF2490 domain-containing protein [Runella salmonicolor]